MASKKKSPSRKTAAKTSSRRGKRRSPDDGLEIGSDKLYFKIGEVGEIVGVAPHVLRYWETEFRAIKPQKSRSQQRVYRRRDVETLLKIKHLLYDQKFTIAGARQQLSADRAAVETAPPAKDYRVKRSLEEVRRQLDALRQVLVADDERDPAAADPAAYLQRGGHRLGDGGDVTSQSADRGGDGHAEGPQQPLLERPGRDARS